MPYYLKIINVFLLATVKFFYTPIAAYLLKLSLLETMITMISGGILSFITFYYLTSILLITSNLSKPFMGKVIPDVWQQKFNTWQNNRALKKKQRRKFTRRNKLIVKIRNFYGFWGIVITTPVVLSIPLGAFLMHKYYRNKNGAIIYPVIAISVEGIILCFLYYLIPGLRP